MSATLVSVGYEGRDVAELITTLLSEDVQVLVDVRMTPISRKKGLSKSALRSALETAGIRYVHHRELGNPKENREGFRSGSRDAVERFESVLASGAGEGALRHVVELMGWGTVALLCFERDHASCHRRLVADAIARGASTEVTVVSV